MDIQTKSKRKRLSMENPELPKSIKMQAEIESSLGGFHQKNTTSIGA